MMAIFKTELRKFLSEVLVCNYPIDSIFSDEFFEEFFSFEGTYYESPDEKEKARVQRVCQVNDPEQIDEIWLRAVSTHYEQTFMNDYYEAILEELESVVVKSFESLTTFFSEELEEEGIQLSTLTPFEAKLDWDSDILTIEGDLTALELILIEILRAEGCRYEGLEEFIEVNGANQEHRIKQHLHHLGEIENIYGTCFSFFLVDSDDICELDRYRCFGDGDVTDQELREAICA